MYSHFVEAQDNTHMAVKNVSHSHNSSNSIKIVVHKLMQIIEIYKSSGLFVKLCLTTFDIW